MLEWLSPPWPMWANVLLFLLAATAIGLLGPRMAKTAQELGDRLGISEALAGAILLGMTTSLPGIAAVATAGAAGGADLAVSTAFGGIIAQTSFLVVADLLYRRRNLEHDVHTTDVMMTGLLLIGLLGVAIMAVVGPGGSFWGIHPATLLLPIIYLGGLLIIYDTGEEPGWHSAGPQLEVSREMAEQPETEGMTTWQLSWRFAVYASVVAVAGWLLMRSGGAFGAAVGLDDSLVGSLLVGQATSLPELVTAIAAVRIGAPALAVADIIGGNTFDVLFVAVGDLFYREGSIYHAVTDESIFLAGMGLLATTVLVMGLIHREESGVMNIGFEEIAIFVIYTGGFGLLFFW